MTGAYYTHDGRVELCRSGTWNRPTMVRVKAWNLDEQKIVYEKYLESRQQKTMKICDGGGKFISKNSTVVKSLIKNKWDFLAISEHCVYIDKPLCKLTKSRIGDRNGTYFAIMLP